MIKIVVVIRNSILNLSLLIIVSFLLLKNICLLEGASITNRTFNIDRDDFVLYEYLLNAE